MKGTDILLGLGIFLILTLITFYWALLVNPAYEDSCRKLMTEEFDYQITDSQYVSRLISCQNYFDGHPIAEYWSVPIGLMILWAIISIVIVAFKVTVADF